MSCVLSLATSILMMQRKNDKFTCRTHRVVLVDCMVPRVLNTSPTRPWGQWFYVSGVKGQRGTDDDEQQNGSSEDPPDPLHPPRLPAPAGSSHTHTHAHTHTHTHNGCTHTHQGTHTHGVLLDHKLRQTQVTGTWWGGVMWVWFAEHWAHGTMQHASGLSFRRLFWIFVVSNRLTS